MSNLFRISALAVLCAFALGLCCGCGRAVKGPRFWWDDQKREKLPDDFSMPPPPEAKPSAPAPHPIPESLKDDKDKQEEKQAKKEGRTEPAAPAPAPDKPAAETGKDSSAGAIPQAEK